MGYEGIRIGDVTLRNIQQQVEKNKNDIAAWTTLDAFGIKVLGIVATDADIPEGEYNYGDAYLVGTEEPYDLYVYTRGTENFVNIGPLTVVGPQGPTGAQGPAGTITIGTVTTGDPGSSASVINVGTEAAAILNIQIPRGNTGAQGPIGETGPQGPTGATGATGAQGPQGDPGQSFLIIGTISSVSQLPDPTDSPRNEAYVYDDGDSSTPNRLYYITGTVGNEQWSYSPLAAAGTTISIGGNPVSSWAPDTKLSLNGLLNMIYPVGSIYISAVNTSPETLFGGTWEAQNSGNVCYISTKNTIAVANDTEYWLRSSITKQDVEFINTTAIAPSNQSSVTMYSSSGNTQNLQANETQEIKPNTVTGTLDGIAVYVWKRRA